MPAHHRKEERLNESAFHIHTASPTSHVPPELVISKNEIHVWSANLDCESDAIFGFEPTLSEDEKSRADRFIFARDRNRFVAARGILRELLGTYLRTPPARLEFTYGQYGKPSLRKTNPTGAHLQFSLSHSHGVAVYAIAHERNVGIDVELIRAEFASDGIAERYFSARELEELRALPPEERSRGFFRCWTRKEAYIKARGKGLQILLDSSDVTIAPSVPTRFLKGVPIKWHLESFTPARNYAAALVYDGTPCRIRYFPKDRPANVT